MVWGVRKVGSATKQFEVTVGCICHFYFDVNLTLVSCHKWCSVFFPQPQKGLGGVGRKKNWL